MREIEAVVEAQTIANANGRPSFVVLRKGEWVAVACPLPDDDVHWEIEPSSTDDSK